MINNGGETFSDNLVGLQKTGRDGFSLFTFGNFSLRQNTTTNQTQDYRLGGFNKTISLNDQITTSFNDIVINFDYRNYSDFCLYGSLTERFRVAINNIVKNFPAALVIENFNLRTNNITSVKLLDNNTSSFVVSDNNIINPYFIAYLNTDTRNLNIRDFIDYYADYVLEYNGNEYPILSYSADNSNNITFTITGTPFNNDINQKLFIKLNKFKRKEILNNLGSIENYLLNTKTSPIYTSSFNVFIEDEFTGEETLETINLTWPCLDGYHPNIDSADFNNYVEELRRIGVAIDNYKTNVIVRQLITPSILEFDTEDIKIQKILQIYGRSLDDVKKYINGLSYMNKVSYDKLGNIPDQLIKNFAETLGWEVASYNNENDLLSNVFGDNTKPISGFSEPLTPFELDIELWRRLVINSKQLFNKKGTREAIKFILNFIGAPESLLEFNEYVYVAEQKLNLDKLETILALPDNVDNISRDDLFIDNSGNPRFVFVEDQNKYFESLGIDDLGRTYKNHYENIIDNFGFNLTKVVDNKKSWVNSGATTNLTGSSYNRYYGINNQYTNYNIIDDKLVINTKNVDLFIRGSKRIENEIFNFNTKISGITDTIDTPDNFNRNLVFTPTGFTLNTFEFVDDKIYLGGNFTGVSGTNFSRIVRLNPDASIDTSFNVGASIIAPPNNQTSRTVNKIKKISDGIIVAGNFGGFNTTFSQAIFKLNFDGTLNTTFSQNLMIGYPNFPSGPSLFAGLIRDFIEQDDGKLIIGGEFTNFSGVSGYNHVIRINGDGSFDPSFRGGSFTGGPNSSISIVKKLTNGDIILAGDLTQYSGQLSNRIVKVDKDGFIVQTLPAASGIPTAIGRGIRAVEVQKDDKIILGGAFTGFSSGGFGSANAIVRLNSNLTRDTSFVIGTGFQGGNDQLTTGLSGTFVSTIVIQEDGKIIVGGNFTNYNGTSANRLIRLNTDGSIDTSFLTNLGSGFNNRVNNVAISPDGGIIVVGNFTQFNGKNFDGIVRLDKDGLLFTRRIIIENYVGAIRDFNNRLPYRTTISTSVNTDLEATTIYNYNSDVFNKTITQNKSFYEYIKETYSTLINVKNRKVSRGYPSLQYLWYIYYQSVYNPDKTITYSQIYKYMNYIDGFWLKLVKQFIPATTILTAGNKVDNTIYGREKYNYKHGIDDGSEFKLNDETNYKYLVNKINKTGDTISQTITPATTKINIKVGEVKGLLKNNNFYFKRNINPIFVNSDNVKFNSYIGNTLNFSLFEGTVLNNITYPLYQNKLLRNYTIDGFYSNDTQVAPCNQNPLPQDLCEICSGNIIPNKGQIIYKGTIITLPNIDPNEETQNFICSINSNDFNITRNNLLKNGINNVKIDLKTIDKRILLYNLNYEVLTPNNFNGLIELNNGVLIINFNKDINPTLDILDIRVFGDGVCTSQNAANFVVRVGFNQINTILTPFNPNNPNLIAPSNPINLEPPSNNDN